jgi:arginine deiminase
MGTVEAVPAILGEVGSEIAPLRAVLVHRPGRELDGLDENGARAHLFDGALWPEGARREHDALVGALVGRGVQVFHLRDLLAGVLALAPARERALSALLGAANLDGGSAGIRARRWLERLDAGELASLLVEGDPGLGLQGLSNQMFVRDSSAWVGRELLLGSSPSPVRHRETLQLQLIYEFHPLFADTAAGVPGAVRAAGFEGGDLLVLSERAVAIGVGERTSARVARRLAQRLFAAGLEEAIVVELPRASFAIHLDCLLGVVDHDAVLFDRRLTELSAWRLRPAPGPGVSVEPADDLLAALGEGLGGAELRQIEVADAREQWHHAANVLPLAPGTVVAYDHNRATNGRLEAAGIEVIGISGRELGRGRGGPRCLACPLARGTLATF